MIALDVRMLNFNIRVLDSIIWHCQKYNEIGMSVCVLFLIKFTYVSFYFCGNQYMACTNYQTKKTSPLNHLDADHVSRIFYKNNICQQKDVSFLSYHGHV